MKFDYLVVGAGFAGMVLAERLAVKMGRSCLVVDRRSHIGGNSYDEYDENGVLVHKYGPHYFRTNSHRIRKYLSKFTEWNPVAYKISSWCDGRYWSFPINLNTYEELIGRSSSETEFKAYLEKERIPIENPKNSEEVIISQVGWAFYERFFKNYTMKQWRCHPRDLDPSVCGRIPIRTNRDDRYLKEDFQALPASGYHRMFIKMLESSKRISLMLNTDYRNILNQVKFDKMIYTGAIDEYYEYAYAPLKYRSLRFERTHYTSQQVAARSDELARRGFWQPTLQVNYPNENSFTRTVEMKHATRQDCRGTTVITEYPQDYSVGKEPYYPLPTADALRQYKLYEERAARETNVIFVGRLATYRYYNMDQVVGMALATFDELSRSK